MQFFMKIPIFFFTDYLTRVPFKLVEQFGFDCLEVHFANSKRLAVKIQEAGKSGNCLNFIRLKIMHSSA